MALLHFDGFDAYATADLLARYGVGVLTVGASTLTIASGGRNGTTCLRHTASGNFGELYLQRGVPAGNNVGIMGYGYYPTAIASSNDIRNGLFAYQHNTTIQCSIRVNSDGSLSVLRGGSSGTVLATSASGVISLSTYQYLEFKALIHASAGAYEVRVNNATVLSGSGVNTAASGSATWTAFRIFTNNGSIPDIGGGQYWNMDDLYVLDGVDATATQGAPLNDFLGSIRVAVKRPNAAGNYSQFTPSAGANYTNVDDTTPDGDTTTNTAATLGFIDTYQYSALGVGGTVYAAQVLPYLRSGGGGAETRRSKIRISSTDYNGTTTGVSTSYGFYPEIFGKDPSTGSAWASVSAVDAAEFGEELVS